MRRISLTGSAKRSGGFAFLLAATVSLQACTGGASSESAADSSGAASEMMMEQTTSLPDVALLNSEPVGDSPLLPVYWLGRDNNLLYREFLPDESAGDPIAAAIWAMTSAQPVDDDYYTPWQQASAVNTSISTDNVITVDITSDAFGGDVAKETASMAIQQLVYTATAAAANAGLIASGSPSSVRVLVDGKAGYVAFGAIELGAELQRNAEAVGPVWIINPQNESIRTDPTLIVQGSTTLTGPELGWSIHRVPDDGSDPVEVQYGTVAVESANGASGLFEFSISVEPGTYQVRVFDRATGAGSIQHSDDKLITIR